ncbi:MAG: phosphatidylserine decarboxylase [Victivallaceae bacterium]
MTLTKYGIREWGGGGIFAFLLLGGGVAIGLRYSAVAGWSLAVAAMVSWLGLAAFFRSPRRRIPPGSATVVSPADGVIADIVENEGEKWGFPAGSKVYRIGIFLSVLDVHLNRAPAAMTVESKQYQPGRFLDARDPDATRANESMLIFGHAEFGDFRLPLAVRQISGAIARRIVCRAKPGMMLAKGELFGMIKFGSRTELYLARDQRLRLTAEVGDRVRAGTAVLAEIITQGDT